MHYIVGLLIAEEFKRMVNWVTLRPEDVILREGNFENDAPLRNFVILTALKI